MPALRPIRSHAALRGVAALLVVAYHFQFGLGYRLAIEEATPFFRRGYLWVDLFFVLSGFIISYVNDAARDRPMAAAETRRFLFGRFARLYPLHIVCLAAYVAVAALASAGFATMGHRPPFLWDDRSLTIIAAQALLINAWFKSLAGWNIPSWSISAELVAYALFPLLVGLHARYRRASEATMLVLAAAFMIGATKDGSLDITGGILAPCRCVAGFMLGMLVYFHRARVAALSPALLALLQFVAVGGIAALLATETVDPWIVPFFMLLVGTSWTDRGPVARLLERRPLLWLGDVSYSIYLVHVPIIELVGLIWPRLVDPLGLSADLDRLLWLITATVMVLATAHLTYNGVERPARQWLARRWLGHRVPPIATSPAGP